MNDLMTKFDVNAIDEQDLEFIQQQITNRQLKNMVARLEQTENKIAKLEEKYAIKQTELENKIEDVKTESEKKLEVSINTYGVDRNKWGYESQADFGNRFRVSIGSVTVGKLFKSIGLAKSSKGKTEPYRQFISKYATTEIVKGHPTFRWHHENCLNFLENWLKENKILEEFYSISTEKEMLKFINKLYNERLEKQNTLPNFN